MAKASKSGGNVLVRSRTSYLYQAATYLENAREGRQAHDPQYAKSMECLGSDMQKVLTTTQMAQPGAKESTKDSSIKTGEDSTALGAGASRHLLAHMRAVAKKGQIRLPTKVKHSTCRRCDALLFPNVTSAIKLENKSRGGAKPWANMLVVTCDACGTSKRFPASAARQPKRAVRQARFREKRDVREA